MRYIYDGELRDKTAELPTLFIVDEACTHGRGRTDTTLQAEALAPALAKVRKGPTPTIVGHRGEP